MVRQDVEARPPRPITTLYLPTPSPMKRSAAAAILNGQQRSQLRVLRIAIILLTLPQLATSSPRRHHLHPRSPTSPLQASIPDASVPPSRHQTHTCNPPLFSPRTTTVADNTSNPPTNPTRPTTAIHPTLSSRTRNSLNPSVVVALITITSSTLL